MSAERRRLELVTEEWRKAHGPADVLALRGGGGGGTSGPMEPWQQSVEARLGSLDARLGRIEPAISGIRADLAASAATTATQDDARAYLPAVTALQQDMAVVKATMATKQDLHDLERAIGTRMQRYLAIGGTLVALVTVLSTWAAKLFH